MHLYDYFHYNNIIMELIEMAHDIDIHNVDGYLFV